MTTSADFGCHDVDAYLATHSDYDGGPNFSTTVTELSVIRATLKVARTRQETLQTELAKIHRAGVREIADWVIRTTPARQTPRRSVFSDSVKTLRPQVWAACRVRKPNVRVNRPGPKATPLAVPGIPAARTQYNVAAAIVALREVRDGLIAADTEHKSRLHYLAKLSDWDGELTRFDDGWEVGLWVLNFDSDRMRELYPLAWEKLAVDHFTNHAESVRLVERGDEESFDGD